MMPTCSALRPMLLILVLSAAAFGINGVVITAVVLLLILH